MDLICTLPMDPKLDEYQPEVVAFDDLERCRSMAEARKRGVLRQEGKGYVVKDGDIMHVLFNV